MPSGFSRHAIPACDGAQARISDLGYTSFENPTESFVHVARLSSRIIAALALAVFAIPLFAQTYPIEGFINRLYSPAGYGVNGRRFDVSRATQFGLMGEDSISAASPLRDVLRVGVYVQVAGREAYTMGPIQATTVLVHDEWNERISGLGVITRVLSTGADTVFGADGYRVRITPSTKVSFYGDPSSLDEIAANSWVSFSGKRDKDGVIEATKAHFIPAKPTKFKAVTGLEVFPVKTRPAGSNGTSLVKQGSDTPNMTADGASLQEDQELKVGLGRSHTMAADQPLQDRVHRIGMAVVPEYQREMADDDPSKIHFRFFAIEDNKLRGNINLLDGAMLISRQAVERLSSDDQLAAVLADGVAYSLQRQAAQQVKMNRIAWGAAIAEMFVPGGGLATIAANGLAGGDPETLMKQERLRVALALMRDGGFDPWQAPQAWRMLEPKKLPANVASIDYPDSSCYQIQILNLQYARK
jgi:hypothetical protein